MFESFFNVKYLTSKNCFCCLSVNNFKHLQNKYVKLHYNDDATAYVSVESSSGSIDDQSIGISSLFAKSLGIEENSLVIATEIDKPPTVQTCTVTATSDSDHEVLESLAESVQSTLLEQISILSTGLQFVIWIGRTINVTVTVNDVKPLSPGKIDNLTEVVIKPPEKQYKEINHNDRIETEGTNVSKKPVFKFLAGYDQEEKLILRVVPFTELTDKIGNFSHPFSVFVLRNTAPEIIEDTTKHPKIYLTKLLGSDNETKSVFVRLYIFEDFLKDFKLHKICNDNVFISDTLLEYFNCDIGHRVLLESYTQPLPEINELEIHTKKNYSIDIIETFQQFLADSCKHQEVVLSSDIIINVTSKLRCFVRYQPSEAKFCVVNPDFVRDCKLLFVNEILPQNENEDRKEFNLSKFNTDVGNYRDIIDKTVFLFGFNTEVYQKMYNVLITGKPGTGKTTLTKIVTETVKSNPYYIYVKRINCKCVKGKTVESLHKLFTTTSIELIHHQPSILILDDLHVLCEKVDEGEALAQNSVYFNRVSEMLEGVFQMFGEANAVGILATAESPFKLNKYVYATRGSHFFQNVYNIAQLDKSDRRKLLDFFFSSCQLDNVDLDKFAEKTESFIMQDMVDFADKTLFESYVRDHGESVMKITTKHCQQALETVTETSLSDVNLHPPGDRDLNDIGGLTEAKKLLLEHLLWPSKYPHLFSNAPLRLPSGFLLYGPPGTGKTILAGAAAKHCGLRLISIKGPELLSKYIGASEQAVRDVFHRAQSAKPCILFFDEFDSLAPRRGHDNTGVTDRVVNQLLTQLDGIESLSGVFVLAATSRPDLLDPALLRPGRLDKHIYCSLPDEVSRLEILKVLSKSLQLSSDVNLSELAQGTENFSGADLQAVLYSAQLDSFKGILEDEANVQEFRTEIHQGQLMAALRNTRQSLNKTELRKYEQIYREFEGSAGNDFTPGSRATLA